MHELLKRLLIRAFRIPPEPAPPAGSSDSLRVFRAARNYYRYNQMRWAVKQIGALAGIALVLGLNLGPEIEATIPWRRIPIFDRADRAGEGGEAGGGEVGGSPFGGRLFFTIEMLALAFLIGQGIVTYAMVRLDYEMRWYFVTDRSLRIREGVVSIREMTMTFANVQNLSIEQGPIQRLLGISDLRVRTAGGGSGDPRKERFEKEEDSMHVGYLRGVDDPERIRDSILTCLRRLKDSGLGDPDDTPAVAHEPVPTPGKDALTAARDLLDEARALRRAGSVLG